VGGGDGLNVGSSVGPLVGESDSLGLAVGDKVGDGDG